MEDAQGNIDLTCGTLIHELIKNCQNRMHCSPELFEKYFEKLKSLRNQSSAAYMQKMLIHLKNKQKIQFHNSPPTISQADKEKIPSDDVYLILLTIFTKSTLITTDCRLKDRLDETKLSSKYSLTIVKPWT